MSAQALIERARVAAAEIAADGHMGWGNTVADLAAALERLQVERDKYLAANDATLETLAEAVRAQGRLIAERDRAVTALGKIDIIRNSIIGAQKVNWSEHVYPLVSALDGAGLPGLAYDEAKANLGTLLERNKSLETERDALQEQVKTLQGKLTVVATDPYFNQLDAESRYAVEATLAATGKEKTE